MKKQFLLVVGLMTIIFLSCNKEEIKPGKETGKLVIDIGLAIREYEVNKGLKVVKEPSEFKVVVYRADGSEAMVFETASVMPDTIELEPGSYYVEAHSDNDIPADFDNPYYYGESEVFTIISNMLQAVDVSCRLANTMVTVVYSGTLAGHFINYSTMVSSELDTLIFGMDETRAGYFRPSPLTILVELTSLNPDGSESMRALSGSIPQALAGRHYEIFVNPTISAGMATFRIFMDETEIPLEVIEISEDTPQPETNTIGYGEILFTEIMYDPTALSDTEGEWIEIYNNSNRTINLQNLVLRRDALNNHTIADSIELLPGDYYVLARTAIAVEVPNRYVYGTSVLLPNTGGTLTIYNKTVDAEPGTLIFSITYGGAGFPSGSGASIILSPDRMNATDAVLGTSWCKSSSVYSTGDLGTPGGVNDLCW